MKSILVTGGSGFIGNCLCKLLLFGCNNKYRVINVDIETYASNHNTIKEELSNSNYKFYKIDIRDKEGIDYIFNNERPDIVVNLAAETHVDKSFYNEELFYDTNVNGVKVLLDACLKYNVKRFHQVSTDEVYGDIDNNSDSIKCFNESSSLNPTNPYSKSKAKADLLVLEYFNKYNLPITISRCSNNYGIYQYPEKLIPLMIYLGINDKSLPIYGDGLNKREWINVLDHCNAILSIIEKGRVGEIYNIGTGIEKTNIEIVNTILDILNKPKSLIHYVKDRVVHDKRYLIDSSKIKDELGWHPNISFDEGIKDTINWYISSIGKKWLDECNESNKEWLKKNYSDRDCS